MSASKAEGFTLIEAVVSLGVFALIFSGALSVMLSGTRLAGWNRETRDSLACLEGLRAVMSDSMTYGEVMELKNTGRVYVKGEDLEMDAIKESKAGDIFTGTEPAGGSYVSLQVTEGPVLEAELRLHVKMNGRTEIISSKFYKGNYKR